MALHLLLVTSIIFALTLFLGLLNSIRRIAQWRFAHHLLAVVLSLGSTSLIFLYIVNFLSNALWGDHVSYDLVRNNVRHLDTYLSLVNVWPAWVYLFLAGTCVVIFGFYFRVSRWLLISLTSLQLIPRIERWFRTRRRVSLTFVVLAALLAGYLVIFFVMLRSVRGGGAAQREPILSLFLPRAFFTHTPDIAALNLRDQLIRKQLSARRDFDKKNVVLIIADSLRADRTPIYGYGRSTTPFLSKLLEEKSLRKVQFAAANCSATYCAVLSILGSRNSPRLHPGNLKIHDLLRDQGYKVHFILSGDHANWLDLKQAYGASIDSYFDGTRTRRFPPTDDRLIFEGLDLVPKYDGQPSFFYFHLMSAHSLGIRLDEHSRFQPAQKEMYGKLLATYDPHLLSNTYDNAVVQTDDFIRQIFTILDQKGYLDNSVVFILSDHGQGLGEHGRYAHGKYLYQEQIRIPLLIHDRPEVSYRNLEFATQIDIAPTILDRLGLAIPSSWEGRSLIRPSSEQYSYHQTMENVPWRAVLYKKEGAIYKLLFAETDSTEELYELRSDPGEANNLIRTADPSLLLRMRQLMKESVIVR